MLLLRIVSILFMCMYARSFDLQSVSAQKLLDIDCSLNSTTCRTLDEKCRSQMCLDRNLKPTDDCLLPNIILLVNVNPKSWYPTFYLIDGKLFSFIQEKDMIYLEQVLNLYAEIKNDGSVGRIGVHRFYPASIILKNTLKALGFSATLDETLSTTISPTVTAESNNDSNPTDKENEIDTSNINKDFSSRQNKLSQENKKIRCKTPNLKIPHKNNCSYYYECSDSLIPTLKKCPKHHVFRRRSQSCVLNKRNKICKKQ